jgi:SAM-dependent methyltransferase
VNERPPPQPYLRPYLDAAAAQGAGFRSLLWASPTTQAIRFEAIRNLEDMNGKSLLDVGCGRADLLEFLLRHGVRPADYIGIEAVDALADAAESKRLPNTTILRADFVAEPLRLFVGADVVILSGSLNTADDPAFYATLSRAYDATAQSVVFNFLSSTRLAGQSYLYWRRPEDVLRFVRGLSPHVTFLQDYLAGDMTVRVAKPPEAAAP